MLNLGAWLFSEKRNLSDFPVNVNYLYFFSHSDQYPHKIIKSINKFESFLTIVYILITDITQCTCKAEDTFCGRCVL